MPPRRTIEALLADCAKKPTFFSVTDTRTDTTRIYDGTELPKAITTTIKDSAEYLSAVPGDSPNTRWVLGNENVEVYFEYTPVVYDEDKRSNRPAVYRIVREAVATQGICIRRALRIPDTQKSNVELRLFQANSEYHLQFLIPAIHYKAHIDEDLKNNLAKVRSYIHGEYLKDDIEWFKCALGWLKQNLYLPAPSKTGRGGRATEPTRLVHVDSTNLYRPVMPDSAALGRNSEFHFETNIQLKDFVAEDIPTMTVKEKKQLKAEFTKTLTAWAADIPLLLATSAPPRPVYSSPSDTDAVLKGSPMTAVSQRSSRKGSAASNRVLQGSPMMEGRKPSVASAASERVLQGSPIITPAPFVSPPLQPTPPLVPTVSPTQKPKPKPKQKIEGLKLTKQGVKKPLFEGKPILASITGDANKCIHTSEPECFIIDTITTVKKDSMTFDVAPSNEKLYNLLKDIRNPAGKETYHSLFVIPSPNALLVVETTKNAPKIPGKMERSIFRTFHYEKRGGKYNFILDEKIQVTRI